VYITTGGRGVCTTKPENREIVKRLRPDLFTLAVFLYLALIAVSASAQMTGADFCQGPNPAKQSAAISITTSGAGEHLLVDAVAGQTIQVCSYRLELAGTTPSAEFDYGTAVSTACDTAPTALTGAMVATPNWMTGSVDYFTAPAAKQLCLKLGGTTPTALGFITYVQK
jgi:hypothetical protein